MMFKEKSTSKDCKSGNLNDPFCFSGKLAVIGCDKTKLNWQQKNCYCKTKKLIEHAQY